MCVLVIRRDRRRNRIVRRDSHVRVGRFHLTTAEAFRVERSVLSIRAATLIRRASTKIRRWPGPAG